MSLKLHQIVILLKRDGQCTPWGIRLVGGTDLDTPLIITRVQAGSPAFGEVLRGDIIAKIGEYDARDLSHADAQTLFRTAGNEIRIVVHRDNKIGFTQGLSADSNSWLKAAIFSPSPNSRVPYRTPSPYGNISSSYERELPKTFFPKLNSSEGYDLPPMNSNTYRGATGGSFSPMPTRDFQQELIEEQAIIVNQNKNKINKKNNKIMEYVQFKNGSPHYYREQPDINEFIQYQVRLFKNHKNRLC